MTAATLYPEAASDCMLVEGCSDGTREERLEAWQRIVDHGLHLVLQGSYGRMAAVLIAEGLVLDPDGEVER